PPLRVKFSVNEIIEEEPSEKEEKNDAPLQKNEIDNKKAISPPIIQPVSFNEPNSNKSGKIFKVNNNEFRLIHLIGRGGTSKVYKVQHENGQIYALKKVVFTPSDQSSCSCYINEVNLLRKLANRESIVRLYDADVNCEKGYLLMVDLANVLSQSRNNNPLNLEQIKIYWKQMLQAVWTIHQENIVHTDLKPANFIIVGGSLKLIDFGIAKMIALDKTSVHTSSQIGTPNYMSPEALCGINGTSGAKIIKLGPACDVWSLGCILYQMVYSCTPFQVFSGMEKFNKIQDPSYHIKFPTTSSSSSQNNNEPIQVDNNLLRIMKGCLLRMPKERPTISELLSDPFLEEPEIPSILSDVVREVLKYAGNTENADSITK
ncbi:2272_t:CDS:10, partial [Ambispora leptoticha]